MRQQQASPATRMKHDPAGSRPTAERRRFPRIRISLVVRYAPRQYGIDVPPDLWVGRTLNISRSGAMLELYHPLVGGGLLEMSLIQSNPLGCVDIVGRVNRCDLAPPLESSELQDNRRTRFRVAVDFTRALALRELRVLHELEALETY